MSENDVWLGLCEIQVEGKIFKAVNQDVTVAPAKTGFFDGVMHWQGQNDREYKLAFYSGLGAPEITRANTNHGSWGTYSAGTVGGGG